MRLSSQQSGNPRRLPQELVPLSHVLQNRCLRCAYAQSEGISSVRRKGGAMQHGSMIRTTRHNGQDVWEFRWREPSGDGTRKHRRLVLGTINELVDEAAARQVVAGLKIDINSRDPRARANVSTFSQLVDHYRQRELEPDRLWKTHSKGDLQRLPEQMDSAQMAKTFIALPQSRRGGVVVALSAFSPVQLCQDPKRNERGFQSWNPARDLRS